MQQNTRRLVEHLMIYTSTHELNYKANSREIKPKFPQKSTQLDSPMHQLQILEEVDHQGVCLKLCALLLNGQFEGAQIVPLYCYVVLQNKKIYEIDVYIIH